MTGIASFITASPSSFHAAETAAAWLAKEGFVRQNAAEPWDANPGGHVLVRDGAMMAWWVPEGEPKGFRILGSHTDSPGFKLKANPALQSAGWEQAGVEVYGGPLLHTWFDRELALAGQVALADGSVRLVHTDPVLRIPSLAIHLYREDTLKIDRQLHVQPLLGTDTPILDVIAGHLGVDTQDILGHDLITIDTQEPRVFGADHDLFASGRLDNLSSVWASVQALIGAVQSGDAGDDVLVVAAFDHEEVGSASVTGAGGALLEQTLRRTAQALGREPEAMFAQSYAVSADAAHAVHPNYPDKHDPVNRPVMGGGPALKINANQRYATTAAGAARWELVCRLAGVHSQTFVGNNAVPCGSTIGPISSTRLGIPTIDVGIPLLSMHSCRELAGTWDLEAFPQALEAFLVA